MNSTQTPRLFHLRHTIRQSLTLILAACALTASPAANIKSDTTPTPEEQKLLQIAEQLDALARIVERYGTISASAPLFITAQSGDKNQFNFSPGTTSADHFRAALQSVQGGQRLSSQSSVVLRAGGSGQVNATAADVLAGQLMRDQARTDSYERGKSYRRLAAKKKMEAALAAIPPETTTEERAQYVAEAEKSHYEDLAAIEETTPGTGATTEPALPELPAAGSLARPADATGLLPIGELTGLRASPHVNPVLSHRAALITAAGDTATQAIFSILGDTEGSGKQVGKRSLLGAMMVNVEPGWGTEEDFIAEISIFAAYRYRPAREPVILAAYPRTNESRVIGLLWRARPQLVYGLDAAAIPDLTPAPGASAEEVEKARRITRLRRAARDAMNIIADHLTKNAIANLGDDRLNDAAMAVDALLEDEAAGVIRERWTKALNEFDRLKDLQKEGKLSLSSTRNTADALAFTKFDRYAEPSRSTDLIPSDLNADVSKFDRNPLSTAVSPMTDAQNLDFDSAIRSRVELSLSLAGALANVGQTAQAEVFSSFARQLQSDIALRTNQAIVTAFSESGSVFGYRISPQLDAVFAPNGKALKSKAKHRLKRTTFPCLIMVTVDETHLGLQFRAAANDDGSVEITPMEPVLELRQLPRWAPVSRPRERGDMFWWRPRRLTQSEMFGNAKTLVAHQAVIKGILDSPTDHTIRAQAEILNWQLQRLVPTVFGSVQEQRLPEDFFVQKVPENPAPPKLVATSPTSINFSDFPASGNWSVAVSGESLDKLTSAQALNVSFAKVELKNFAKTAGRIEVTAAPGGWPKSGTVIFQLSDAKGANTVFTPAITIHGETAEPPPEVSKTVQETDGRVVEIYKTNVTKNGTDLIQALIKRDTPPEPLLDEVNKTKETGEIRK